MRENSNSPGRGRFGRFGLAARRLLGTLLFGILTACAADAPPPSDADIAAHKEAVEEWRANRIAKLTSEDGWVTLIGLFWLDEGEYRLGSAEGSEIWLPADKAPPELGVLTVAGDGLRLDVVEGAEVLHEGQAVTTLELEDDSEGPPTVFDAGDLRAFAIRRGDERALRVRDRQHPMRASFPGIDHYAVDITWRKEARFEAYDPPRSIPVPSILGTVNDTTSSGAVVFEIAGEEHRLDVVAEPGDPELFIIFGDQTSGQETYGGGRYLYADAPGADGKVIVDFNKAYNPPCVYTEFATCPLPPPGNRLPIAVTAGEKADKEG